MAQTKSFRMGGHEILTPVDFCTYFSPSELLRQREMAAGFARRQLAPISPWHNYHGEMLFKAVFCWEDFYDRGTREKGDGWEIHSYASDFCSRLIKIDTATGAGTELETTGLVTGSGFYMNVPGIWRNVMSVWTSTKVKMLKKDMEVDCPQLLKRVWDISQNTTLEEGRKEQLFIILAAGYLLAGDMEMTHSITSEEARSAFLREEITEVHAPKETEEGLEFAASDEEYVIQQSSITTTSSIFRITVKKLAAVQSAQGARSKPVKLRLGDQVTEVMPGDYRYASYIQDQTIRIFPTVKKNGSVAMERRGNSISLTKNGEPVENIDCTGRDILDFAADEAGNYILLEPGKPDYSHFPRIAVLSLPNEDVVQVEIRGNDVYTLNSYGRVTKNGQEIMANFPTSLENLEVK